MCIAYLGDKYGIAIADVTTGDFYVTELDSERKLMDEINKFAPSEIVCNEAFYMSGVDIDDMKNRLNIAISSLDAWYFGDTLAQETLINHFHIKSLKGLGLEDYEVETLREKQKRGSLLWVLDKTKTAMGARLLRSYVEQPLIEKAEIVKRQELITSLNKNEVTREEIKEYLNPIYDLERLITRITYQTANPRDMIAFRNSLEMLPYIKTQLEDLDGELIEEIKNDFDCLEDIHSLLVSSINDEPPISVRDGDIIKEGYNEEVDRLRNAKTEGKTWLAELEASEREKTGIKNLRIKYNKVFGYYLEVTNSFKDLVPDYYVRKQTLTNAERYITPELKELEDTIMGAEDRLVQLEYELFRMVREEISGNVRRIQKTAKAIARIDVFVSLATVASQNNYCKPRINESGIIDIRNGRHPVVEKMISNDMFIDNDTYLDNNKNRISIITGPNMAGKSTYMRQTSLCLWHRLEALCRQLLQISA